MSLIDPQFEFPPTAPTSDFDSFAKNFGFISKHPLRMSANVSDLPRQEETCLANLPYIDGHESESDSNLAYDQTRKKKKVRSRGNINKSEIKLKNFFPVSMTHKQKSILLLYSRHNVYLVVVRDAKQQW